MRRDKSNQVRVLLDTREDGGPLAVHRNHEKRDEGSRKKSPTPEQVPPEFLFDSPTKRGRRNLAEWTFMNPG
jgi:hypothetical protein